MTLQETLQALREAEVYEAELHPDGTLRRVVFGPAVVATPENEEPEKPSGLKSAARNLMRMSEVKRVG